MVKGALTGDALDAFFAPMREAFRNASLPGRSNHVELTFSVGTALFPMDAQTIDELLAKADNAMYKEKIQRGEERT